MARDQTLAVIKVMLTRGSGGRGMMAACHAPTRILSLAAYPAHYPAWQQTGIPCWCASNDWATPPCWRASRPSIGWSRCC